MFKFGVKVLILFLQFCKAIQCVFHAEFAEDAEE